MKYEIKQLNKTDAVVISDEEIEKSDYIIFCDKNILYQVEYKSQENDYNNDTDCKKIIATISPYQIEGLPMLELSNQEEDFTLLDKVIEEESKTAYTQTGSLTSIEIVKRAASAGYKAAQKQYSEDDMKNMFILGGKYKVQQPDMFLEKMKEILQSLQKKQFPIAVELSEDLKIINWHY